MNPLAETNHASAPFEVFTETLSDLKKKLDKAIDNGYRHIILVTYPETGIHEWVQENYANTGYSLEAWLEAYISLTITTGPIEEKRITILSPYQYKTLQRNPTQLGDAKVILATLHPSQVERDELEELAEAYIDNAIRKEICKNKKGKIAGKARNHKTTIRINGRELETLLPAHTAEAYCHKG